MITGAHLLLYSADAEADRAFFRDVLRYPFVDAGHGWLIFRLPPSEVAVHPADGGQRAADFYLMCDDVQAEVTALEAKGVRCSTIERERWGDRTTITLPSGSRIGLYQPTHPTAIGR